MRPRLVALARAAALAASTLVASSALAGPTPAQVKAASDAFKSGADAYKANSFEEAASSFEAADDEVPSPKALRFAIRARDAANQGSRAATLAALALERHGDDADTVTLAKEILAKYEPQLHKVEVSCASPCLLAVGTRIVHGEASTRWTVYVDAGKASIGASFLGNLAARDRTVDAKAGSASRLRFELPKDGGGAGAPSKPQGSSASKPGPRTNTGASDEAKRDDSKRDEPAASKSAASAKASDSGGVPPVLFFVGLGVTAGLAGASVWSGIDTQSSPGVDAVRAACAGQDENCPLYVEGQNKEIRTNALLGVTAAAGVGTVVLALLADWGGGDKGPKRESASFAPWLEVAPGSETAGGAVAGIRGRF
jgi:hypothetical protein